MRFELSKGFSLIEILLSISALAGISLMIAQISKNSASSQVDAYNTADYLQLHAELQVMLENDFDCMATLKGIIFEGSKIKETPIDIEIWHGKETGERSRKFISGSDSAFKKYGKLSINSIQFSMPDYHSTSNFPEGIDETYKAEIKILGDKNKMAKASGFNPIIKSINVVFDTNASGKSTIKSCTKNASVAGNSIISCRKNIVAPFSGPGIYAFKFQADDCAGHLPTDDYTGAVKTVAFCGGENNVSVLDTNESATTTNQGIINGPGVSANVLSPCMWPDGNQGKISVIYFPK